MITKTENRRNLLHANRDLTGKSPVPFSLLIVALSGILFLSCNKTSVFVDRQQVLYAVNSQRSSTNTQGYHYCWAPAKINSDSFSPIGSPWAFPIGLIRTEDEDITVQCKIDASLIPMYDELSHAANASPSLPAGAFNLVKSSVTIGSETLISADSIKMSISYVDGLDLNKDYIVPVRITGVDPNTIDVTDTLRQTIFFQIRFYN